MDKDKTKNKDTTNSYQEKTPASPFQHSDFGGKKVEVQFSAEQTSTDGGLLFLKEVDQNIGLIEKLTSCLEDKRHQSYIEHDYNSLVSQRVMQIAAGYEDANDCNTLRNDGVLKICCGKENSLSTQPTMSRFENDISTKELYIIAQAFVDHFITSYTDEPEVFILDCDDTNSQAYGNQQLSLFNSYYDGHCFMPLHIYEGLSGKLITSILKSGRKSKSVDVFSILWRLIEYLRKSWPDTLIILRGDAHFCSKEFMDWTETKEKIGFVTALSGNQLLNKEVKTTLESAKKAFKKYGKPTKQYNSFQYKA